MVLGGIYTQGFQQKLKKPEFLLRVTDCDNNKPLVPFFWKGEFASPKNNADVKEHFFPFH